MNSTQKPNVSGMVERTCFDKSAALRKKVHDTIPGGAHTYAKGDDQYPERSPGFIERGKGCHIWDVDGNEFIEYGMGLRAVTLGHAYPSVIEAAYRQMQLGNNFNRPAPIELECAQMLQSLVSSAEMVKFAKDGSTVLTAALKLARAYTGRDLVAICSNSPFFSYNDWFIGTTAMDGGVSRVEVELTVKFNYNDIDSLQKLFEQYPNRIAMVLLEPARTEEPKDGFLQKVIDLAHRNGALVTLDETISGFRFHQGGAQTLYGVTPDMSCFGKALANGFSLSALTGKREVMELGGLFHDKERVFLLSTTHGAEGPSLAAAIETMRIYRDEPASSRSRPLWVSANTCRWPAGDATCSIPRTTTSTSPRSRSARCSCRNSSAGACWRPASSSVTRTARPTSTTPSRPSAGPPRSTRRPWKPAAPMACSSAHPPRWSTAATTDVRAHASFI